MFDGNKQNLNKVQLFINGTQQNTQLYQEVGLLGKTTINSMQHLTIGANHNTNAPYSNEHFFNGVLDEFRIYNRALNVQEIQALSLM